MNRKKIKQEIKIKTNYLLTNLNKMSMKKVYLILAAVVGMTITSCTTNDYLGDVNKDQAINDGSIQFGGGFKALTRSDISGSTAAGMLNNAFKIYGVKQNRTTSTNYDKVFVNYSVRYDAAKAGNDEYNNGWYYAGIGSQDVKYWDWASANYHFVAGSPVANFSYAWNGTTGDIETATVTGLGGHLNSTTKNASATPDAVYIADPKVVAKAAYNSEVEFTFRSMQTKLRAGIYETIPGYKITSIQFYNNAASPVASNFITLNSATDNYFQGGSSVTGTVTYNWSAPAYTFAYTSGVTQGKYWEGGEFTSGVPATSSIEATTANLYGEETDMGTNGYFIVMPTPSGTTAAPLTITCDYTLTSLDGSGETIEVKDAKATIPATYTKWAANTAYTYLFKISDNSNGKTDPSQPKEGLYPITFDAVVVNVADAGQNVGTETTVSTPSITVYQNGDVVENGITFNTNAITVTVMNGTTDVTTSAELKYVELASYTYGTDYEKLGAAGAATSWTTGTPTLTSGKTYVLKAGIDTNDDSTLDTFAYFVLVVSAGENGPANS